MASPAVTDTALALLDDRLRNLTYLLHGTTAPPPPTPAPTASARLRTLERALHALAARSPAAADVLALQKAHPALFPPPTTTTAPPPPSSAAALVLAHAPLYTTLSHHLTQLHATPLPDPTGAAKLVDLHARVARAAQKQAQQARDVAALRARSARVVEAWYEAGVLGMGAQWADWEERVREGEILCRRREARRKREEVGEV
ncbi:hypothetical protein LTR08_002331 [Meristemomyces frigidus]|nr:hypothetical protein LTR08_002331 [Meristemomyces frigidus]